MMSRRLNPEEAAGQVVTEREDPTDCDFNFEEEEQPSIAASLSTQSFTQDPFYVFPESSPSHNQQSGPSCSTPISQNSTDSELLSLLRKVVSGQEKLSEQVSDLQERLCTVESCLSSLQSDSSEKETTNRVASQLSKSVSVLYQSFDEEEKFKTSEKPGSSHNAAVRKKIFDEVSSMHRGKYTVTEVNKALSAFFTSRKRLAREDSPSQSTRKEFQEKRRKIQSRKHRLFQRRAKYVRDNEREHWNQLTPDFMSEESDGDDEEFVVHKPGWRSEVLCRFLAVLDRRIVEAQRTKPQNTPRHVRVIGQPLTEPPPPAALAAKWTIRPSILATLQ